MLLESYVSEKKVLVFDTEVVASLDKGGTSVTGHPDKILPSILEAIQVVNESLRPAIASAQNALELEVEFGLKVDSNAVVSIARQSHDAQVVVRLRLK